MLSFLVMMSEEIFSSFEKSLVNLALIPTTNFKK